MNVLYIPDFLKIKVVILLVISNHAFINSLCFIRVPYILLLLLLFNGKLLLTFLILRYNRRLKGYRVPDNALVFFLVVKHLISALHRQRLRLSGPRQNIIRIEFLARYKLHLHILIFRLSPGVKHHLAFLVALRRRYGETVFVTERLLRLSQHPVESVVLRLKDIARQVLARRAVKFGLYDVFLRHHVFAAAHRLSLFSYGFMNRSRKQNGDALTHRAAVTVSRRQQERLTGHHKRLFAGFIRRQVYRLRAAHPHPQSRVFFICGNSETRGIDLLLQRSPVVRPVLLLLIYFSEDFSDEHLAVLIAFVNNIVADG